MTNNNLVLSGFEVRLPDSVYPEIFGTAAEVTRRMSATVGATTILHLGAMDAPFINVDLPEETWPMSRSDYFRKGVLGVHGPGYLHVPIPFMSTAMIPLGNLSMAMAFAEFGVPARIHRYFVPYKEQAAMGKRLADEHPGQTSEQIAEICEGEVRQLNIKRSVERFREIMSALETKYGRVRAMGLQPFMAVAPTSGGMEHVNALREAGCTRFDVDTMGGLPASLKFARELHEALSGVALRCIISGSVSSPQSVRAVAPYSDIIDLGVGNGKSCSTRPQLGIGLHQGLAITLATQVLREMDMLYRESGKGCLIIASGGNIETHDRAYALALGADFVTFGSSTQLCRESDSKGKIVTVNGVSTYQVQVYGMASEVVAGAFSASGTEELTEGDAYWIPFSAGESGRPTLASRVRMFAKALGGTLSSMGAPVLPGVVEYLRQAPVFYYRAPGAELENGTPGRHIIKGG